ncbi:MAG: beta-ketoacyl synthase N-terminal-like domain-containing protein [Acidobacteriota bacterium]
MSGRPQPVAIVGIACRFPGASDPAAYWRLLESGGCALSEVPTDRWDAVEAAEGREGALPALRWGGFLPRIDAFDAAFFDLSPREAAEMDPQQRLALELAFEALEDAGQRPSELRARAVGVYLGALWSDFGRWAGQDRRRLNAFSATGHDLSAIAGRVSHRFGFEGPSMTVATASSSSLVAVHLACQSLAAGDCDLALAGGVNLMVTCQPTVAMARLGTLAPNGRPRPFDAAADGYVRGEGGGVVTLKRLDQALADGDPVYGVIHGGAVTHGGGGRTLAAPRAAGQVRLLRRAWQRAGVSPRQLGYVEAHGTGTVRGDRAELEALKSAVGERDRPLWVGSVKANIGHLEAAAGIAGLIKTTLLLGRGVVPATLGFERPAKALREAASSLAVASRLEPWSDEGRWAGVSSFGFAGTNAHLVLAAAPAQAAPSPNPDPSIRDLSVSARPDEILLPLSAHHPDALRQRARDLAQWIGGEPAPCLADLAYTLIRRRDHFAHRLVVSSSTTAEAARALRAWSAGEDHPAVLAGPGAASGAAGGSFLAGGEIGGPESGQVVPLPPYPYLRQRYWPDDVAVAAATPSRPSTSPQTDWAEMPAAERSAALGDWVASAVAEALGPEFRDAFDATAAAGTAETEPSLLELGLESLAALELQARIASQTGQIIAIPEQLDRLTVARLTELLLARFAVEEPSPSSEWETLRL